MTEHVLEAVLFLKADSDGDLGKPFALGFHLGAFAGTALAIPLLDRAIDAPELSRMGHLHGKQLRISERNGFNLSKRVDTHRRDHFGGHGAGERWWNGIADLARTMPLPAVETEPIGKAVESRHFADSDAAGLLIMDGTRAGERPTGRVGSGAEGVGNAVRTQFEKRDIGSTEPGSVSVKRLREMSEWVVRALDVSKAGSHFRGTP